MPDQHAVLSPSSAHRWLHCTASVRASAGVESRTSPWAEEGTRAHALAELEASHRFELIDDETYQRRLADWKASTDDPLEYAEMAGHVAGYVDLLADLGGTPYLEQRVDPGVPQCWGTADAVLVRDSELDVIDFKYGRGIAVEAENNPQLMLYAVGALEAFDLVDEITIVQMTICQPRLGHQSTATLSASVLREWRDTVIPVAEQALAGSGEFHPSEDACRFCPIAGDCTARTEAMLEADFGTDPATLTPEALADALRLAPQLQSWLNALEKRALERAWFEKIPGYKMVLSGGRRTITDHEAAIQRLIDAGFTAEQVARFSTRPLGELEKLVGRTELPEILEGLLFKSQGREALVPESDKRPEIRDFVIESS